MVQDLVWRLLADRRNYSKLIMIYKIYHSLVAIPLTQYIHMHPLYLQKVQIGSIIHISAHSTTLWDKPPADIATLLDLAKFKRAVVNVRY
ncbi:hypothetical protein DPMN_106750 [Dreissena polymorpha]|uniref:Uncharacterized protein n=1 Tax=Dreissena polymorpha TaxID=45954 RepID=A0A9D4K5M2_DREPO|nr:hypothetical protein DPMN_106750 [Dreissena polymorpha]